YSVDAHELRMERRPSTNMSNVSGYDDLLVDANFAEKTGNLSRDYIGDWMASLKAINKARIEAADEYGEIYLTRETVEYIFTLCIRLRMPIEVRFIAAATFDKFMRVHTRQMINFLAQLDMDTQRKKEEWDCVETNMSRQLTLRICSAIQIASKHVSYHDSLSTSQICKCLRTLGTPYTKAAVLKSEIRLMKAVDFRIPPTPVVYAESVLKLFVLSKRPDLHAQSVWDFICILMDVMFMERETIYNNLLASIVGDISAITATDKNRLKSDWILLACALVCAGCCCHYGFDVGDKVSVELEEACETPAKDTSELAIALLEVARGRTGSGGEGDERDHRPFTPPPNKRFAAGAGRRPIGVSRVGSLPFAAPTHRGK
ncbi:hypothetical protein PFISCL1PPCAC_24779, partial [Pristionchus fissidentatus]